MAKGLAINQTFYGRDKGLKASRFRKIQGEVRFGEMPKPTPETGVLPGGTRIPDAERKKQRQEA